MKKFFAQHQALITGIVGMIFVLWLLFLVGGLIAGCTVKSDVIKAKTERDYSPVLRHCTFPVGPELADCDSMVLWRDAGDSTVQYVPATHRDTLHVFRHWQPLAQGIRTYEQLMESEQKGVWTAAFMLQDYIAPLRFRLIGKKLTMYTPYMGFIDARSAMTWMDVQPDYQQDVVSSLRFVRQNEYEEQDDPEGGGEAWQLRHR